MKIAEPEPPGRLGPLRQLAFNAREGLPMLAGELQLDKLGTRIGDGDRQGKSEGAEHPRVGRRRERSLIDSQEPVGTVQRATRAPSDCNFNSIPS